MISVSIEMMGKLAMCSGCENHLNILAETDFASEITLDRARLLRQIPATQYQEDINVNNWSVALLKEIFIGYAQKGSALIYEIQLIGAGGSAMDVTLTIHYPDNVVDPRIVIIDSMVSKDWIESSEK